MLTERAERVLAERTLPVTGTVLDLAYVKLNISAGQDTNIEG